MKCPCLNSTELWQLQLLLRHQGLTEANALETAKFPLKYDLFITASLPRLSLRLIQYTLTHKCTKNTQTDTKTDAHTQPYTNIQRQLPRKAHTHKHTHTQAATNTHSHTQTITQPPTNKLSPCPEWLLYLLHSFPVLFAALETYSKQYAVPIFILQLQLGNFLYRIKVLLALAPARTYNVNQRAV